MTSAPKWFVPVAVLALLWNLLGCAAVAMNALLTPADLAAMSRDEQLLHAAMPAWMPIGSLLAVGAGALGSLGLVLKRRWAKNMLLLSLLGVLVQDIGFVQVSRVAPLPFGAVALQAVVLLVALVLVLLARSAAANGWLK
jgi:hypothetical protein